MASTRSKSSIAWSRYPFSLFTRPLSHATVHGGAPAADARRSALGGFVEASFLEVDAGEVQRAIGPAEPLDFGERVGACRSSPFSLPVVPSSSSPMP